MAIVIAPALSFRARGKVGAINYSETHGVAVARGGYSPVQPNTAAQVAIQDMFTSVTQTWSTLTKSQVGLWRDLASQTVLVNRLGQKYQPSAYNLFCRKNMNLKKVGSSIVLEPAERQSEDMILDAYTSSTVPTVFTTWVNWMSGNAIAPIIRYAQYAGPFDSVNRQPQSNDWNIGWVTPKSTVYNSKYGLTSGKYYWARVQGVYDNGDVSHYVYVQHLVT